MSLMKRTEQDVQKMNRVELTPASRVLEGEEAYTLTVELPGVSEKEIELTLENRVLSITAENTLETFKDY
ncbi:MAG: Hsp20/alpha crystallin family protein, partial [Lentisphaerae bacterium]|nr:Hsp20/alpha crystallin family protein [Lentisphaerota bacterium]